MVLESDDLKGMLEHQGLQGANSQAVMMGRAYLHHSSYFAFRSIFCPLPVGGEDCTSTVQCKQPVLRFFSLCVTEIFLAQRKIAALNNVESCPANSHFRFPRQHVVFIEWHQNNRFWGEFDQWPKGKEVTL